MQRIPLKKMLSYFFAKAANTPLLCSKIFVQRMPVSVVDEFYPYSEVGTMIRLRHHWLEARPSSLDKDRFLLKHCTYDRHGWLTVGGNRKYSEGILERKDAPDLHWTRAEALKLIAKYEAQWNKQGFSFIHDQPLAVRLNLPKPEKNLA